MDAYMDATEAFTCMHTYSGIRRGSCQLSVVICFPGQIHKALQCSQIYANHLGGLGLHFESLGPRGRVFCVEPTCYSHNMAIARTFIYKDFLLKP